MGARRMNQRLQGVILAICGSETINDVKNVIDQWADNAAKRLKELRDSRGGS